jgi:hypothetical protein
MVLSFFQKMFGILKPMKLVQRGLSRESKPIAMH